MANKDQVQTIFFLGPVIGAYRTQYLLKFLKDNPKFCIFYIDDDFFIRKSRSYFNRIIGLVIGFLTQFFYLIFSDVVIVPAMSYKDIRWYKFVVFLKKRMIVDFYISKYDTEVLDRKNVNPQSKRARLLMEHDAFLIKNGNPVVFLNYTELNYYAETANCSVDNINYKIVPLCIESRNRAKLPFINSSSDIPAIRWWGSYIPLHGLEKIIEMASILTAKKFSFSLILFGNSEKLSLPYRELINKYNLNDIVRIENDYSFYNGKLENVLENDCDLALGNFGDSDKAKKVFLNKIGDAFAMGIPILTMKTEALNELVDTNEDVFIAANNPVDMAEKVLEIFQNKKRALEVADNGNRKYNIKFSPKQYFNSLDEIYN